MTTEPMEDGYLVVQEGGSSTEAYPCFFDTIEDAWAFRDECWKDGAYRTSRVVTVPASIYSGISNEDMVAFVDSLVEALMTEGYGTGEPE